MPELQATGDLFNVQGDAGFETGIIHGRIAGDAHIGVTAEAELCHGLEVALGAEAAAEAQALLAILLPALRAQGTAFASAGVKLSVQLSPDIFDKIGFTARAEAQAQGSVAGRLAIGLDFHTVAMLARDQMSNLAYDIFIAFLNELIIEAGVWGKASFAAMAHAHLEVNGTLASDSESRFVITAGGDVGWGGGTGWDFYAGLQFKDVKRFYHTTAHLITEEVVLQARLLLPAGYGPAIALTDLLLPTVLVAGFELGQMSALELVRWAERADQNAAPFGRAFQRQLQRFLIDKMGEAAGLMLERYLDGAVARFTPDSLPAARRDELEEEIRALIDELQTGPLDVSRFPILVAGITEIVETLFPDELRLWRRPLTIAWCALTLGEAMRIAGSKAGAGVSGSLIGLGSISAHAQIDSIPQPPELILHEFTVFLGSEPDLITPADAVDYLVAIGLAPLLEEMLPDLAVLLNRLAELMAGAVDLTTGDIVEAALRGAAGEDLSDTDLYLNLRDWMRRAIEDEILGDMLPALRTVLDDNAEALLYLDEVVEPSFLIATNFMFDSLDRVVAVATRPAPGDEFYNSFKLGLSAMVWRIFSRNVVVISDILTHHAITQLHTSFHALRQEVAADPQHAFVTAGVDLLSQVSPNLQAHPTDVRDAVHDLFTDLFQAGALAFGPQVWTEPRRVEMRQLMIRLLESIDTGLDYRDGDAVVAFFNQLRECFYVPDTVGLQQLGELLLAVTKEELAVIFEHVVPALEIFWLRLTLRTVEDMEAEAHQYIAQLAALVQDAWAEWQMWVGVANDLLAEAEALAAEVAAAVDDAAELMRSDALQDAIVADIRRRGLDAAAALARNAPGFDLMGPDEQNTAIAGAQTTFLIAFLGIEPLLRTGLDVLGESGDNLGDMIEDAATPPELIEAVANDAQERVENAIVALGITWPEALGLDDVTDAAHSVISDLASLVLALEASLDLLLAEREVRLAANEAKVNRDGARAQWETEKQRQGQMSVGPLHVHIHSPNPVNGRPDDNWLYPRDIPIFVEIAGANPGFLQADLPRRVLLAVNGRPLLLETRRWQYDSVRGAILLRHTLTVNNSLLRDGLNTLEVSVVDGGEQQHRQSISFAVDTSLTPQPGLLQVAGDLSQYDAPGNDHVNTSQEYITLRNPGDRPLNLTNWRLEDRAGHRYRFPQYELLAHSTVRIRTGSGNDNADNLYWGRNQAVWNNRGDAIYVVDADNVLRAEHVY